MEQEGKALHINLSASEEARKERLEAMTHGITVFTEEETVRAFYKAVQAIRACISQRSL